MAQPVSHILTVSDELALLIFHELGFEDQRAVIRANKQLQWTFSPEFFECLGPLDIGFLNANEQQHDVAGFHKFGHRLKNLSIHNLSRDMLPIHEESKLKEVLAPYYDGDLEQGLESLVFSTNSTLRISESSFRARPNSVDSFKIIENILLQGRLPQNVVLPAVDSPRLVDSRLIRFGAIIATSAIELCAERHRQRRTTFYLRPGTVGAPFNASIKSHGSKVNHLSLFGDHRHFQHASSHRHVEGWLSNLAFNSLQSISFYAFDLCSIVDCMLPVSIEALSFIDNIIQRAGQQRGQEEVMERFLLVKSKDAPGIKPILKKFVHRQTARWTTGVCSIAGETLTDFIQKTSNMLEQYACHRHGLTDRSFEDIQGFVAAAPELIGFGTNFHPILYTELEPREDFERQADNLARSLAGARSLKTLLLYTPATNATFNQSAKSKLRAAVTYIADKLAMYSIDLDTVFVVNRDILIKPNHRGQVSHAVRFRIVKKFDIEGNPYCGTSLASNKPSQFSEHEFEQLRKLGGDLLLTYNGYERHGLGALYLGKDETLECQRKRNERLAREFEKRQDTTKMDGK